MVDNFDCWAYSSGRLFALYVHPAQETSQPISHLHTTLQQHGEPRVIAARGTRRTPAVPSWRPSIHSTASRPGPFLPLLARFSSSRRAQPIGPSSAALTHPRFCRRAQPSCPVFVTAGCRAPSTFLALRTLARLQNCVALRFYGKWAQPACEAALPAIRQRENVHKNAQKTHTKTGLSPLVEPDEPCV